MKDKILEKIKNKCNFTNEEIKYMVDNYVNEQLNDNDMSKFIMYIYNNGLNEEETYYLTDAMIKSGKTIDLSSIDKPIVDKHSTGGVGDKVTLISTPIVASLGVCVPKMSGRALGLTGGTVDKLESINGYKLDLKESEFINILKNVGCAVISQNDSIAVADKKIYALRNEIKAVDSIPLIASSIMSKKIASGSQSIVIDLKVGSGAFMKDIKSATLLAKSMINIGKRYDKKVICMLSDMNNPLGRNVGNALEVKEAIEFFDGNYDKRLYDEVVDISSLMIMISKGISYRTAKISVKQSLEIGLAKRKFYEWIKAQKGNINSLKDKSKKYIVMSKMEGYVNSIDSLKIAKLCFDLGSGRIKKEEEIDYAVGVTLNKTVGSKVKKNEILGVIYYNKEIDNKEQRFIDAFTISKKKKRIKKSVLKVIK